METKEQLQAPGGNINESQRYTIERTPISLGSPVPFRQDAVESKIGGNIPSTAANRALATPALKVSGVPCEFTTWEEKKFHADEWHQCKVQPEPVGPL